MARSFWSRSLYSGMARFAVYALSLHDALPILTVVLLADQMRLLVRGALTLTMAPERDRVPEPTSEDYTSELKSHMETASRRLLVIKSGEGLGKGSGVTDWQTVRLARVGMIGQR